MARKREIMYQIAFCKKGWWTWTYDKEGCINGTTELKYNEKAEAFYEDIKF